MNSPDGNEAWQDPSSPGRVGIWAGVLVALLIVVGGLLAISARPTTWTAKVSIVVLPANTIDTGAAANYYDTLSRGQITATIAEIFRLPRFEAGAANQLGLSPSQRRQVAVAVAVVPNTSLIAVTATAPNAPTAESMADTVVDQAASYLPTLTSPYRVSAVNRAAGTATRNSTSGGTLLVVLAVAGVAAGIGTQQAAHQLVSLVRARRLGRRRPVAGNGQVVSPEGANPQESPAPPEVPVPTSPSARINTASRAKVPSRVEPSARR